MYAGAIKVQATKVSEPFWKGILMSTSSVKTLVHISYVLFALAGLFGVAAIVGGHSNAFMTGFLALTGVAVYARAERIAGE
jgi:hypothetical protein